MTSQRLESEGSNPSGPIADNGGTTARLPEQAKVVQELARADLASFNTLETPCGDAGCFSMQKYKAEKRIRKMKKKAMAVLAAVTLMAASLTGCTEAYKVSENISQEADNFNVTRKLTVVNARTDTVLLELTGTFALKNNTDNELEVIIETAEGKYQKDLVYLNDYTMYVVEDISGASVDKYHYEINFLPEWGMKVTHGD